ncbi:MAG: AAA-like domain-containing protein [Desulfobacterales bacterium]|nr:AAA-like domain-containing protein [Desulfobacterales bacterium]
MRRFHSYGPVNSKYHFCIERKAIIETCSEQLVGIQEEGGHYFTIWAPRQTGKTWLMHQVKKTIEKEYPDRFIIGMMSMQGVILQDKDSQNELLSWMPKLMKNGFNLKINPPQTWQEWINYFDRSEKFFEKPVLLFIDEFDALPSQIIDLWITLFRDIYLNRSNYLLHGLALIGVRAVLGVESLRGSPFNIQRSLHVPNFTRAEVVDLYQQYQTESGQKIESQVVKTIFEVTCGQPGLVCWFGELLTETYNTDKTKAIDWDLWEEVYEAALHVEWNNTILNLVKKVRTGYVEQVLALFASSEVQFSVDADWCAYLYLNGVITSQTLLDISGKRRTICRFASPFIQLRLYNALTNDLIVTGFPILSLEPLDRLTDVFDAAEINLPALLERYKAYLKRLKTKGLNPWKAQPRRSDLHLTEAVGHFHLYAWIRDAIGRQCVVSPEFPTGNGRVDLHIRCGHQKGIIEVKSFTNQFEIQKSKEQAAHYAQQLGLNSVTLALFAPLEEDILDQLSSDERIEGMSVHTVAIGWN